MARSPILEYLSVVRNKYINPKEKAKVNYYKVLKGDFKMEIRKTTITIRELCTGYVNDTETDIERGVWAYGGKLCVRPEFQTH